MDTYAMWIKRGKTYDYEDSRATWRMQTAIEILKAAGIERIVEHTDKTIFDWATHRDRHECDACGCKVTWSPWATDEDFETAWRLSSRVHTARGDYNRARR